MLNTILVPLDGSKLAEEALPDALSLARAAGARVVLVRAVPPRRPGSATDEFDSIKHDLEALADRRREEGIRVDAVVHRTFMTDVGPAICSAAQDEQAGLIVMSTHGRSGLGRWVYGSVADSVLRRAEVPVMLIRSQADHDWPKDRTMRILVPLDGCDLAEEALGTAETLATILKAELHLVRVVERPGYPPFAEGHSFLPFDEDAELSDARTYLQGHVDRLRADDTSASMQAVAGLPSTTVPEVARCIGADLIVMATHGRSAQSRLALGSVATATIQRAGMPVLLVRTRLAQEAARDRAVTTDPMFGEPNAQLSVHDHQTVARADAEFSDGDLQLIQRALRSLVYVPGCPHDDVVAGRALAERLERADHSEPRDPVMTR